MQPTIEEQNTEIDFEQIEVFGEVIVGLGVTVTLAFAGKELQLFNV